MRAARTNLTGEDGALDWAVDLRIEGLGVAMLDMQLDTRESHELGASPRCLPQKPHASEAMCP